MKIRIPLGLALATFLSASALPAQETPDAPNVPPARPPEGSRIVNLPSADVPRAQTLTLLFTHRFTQPVQDSDIHSLYSFDSGALIGIGLAYTLIENLEVSLYRSSDLDDYELDAKYRLVPRGPFTLSLRAGENWRTQTIGLQTKDGFFAQAIAGFSIGSRVRITAVPTFVSRTPGQRFVPARERIFNVPAAISIALNRTINVQGEIVPRNGRADSPGVGWIASIEKTVVRHRFAFTVGNLRATTVDQYIASDFSGLSPKSYFFGFNLVRQWKL
jgi:Membrane bound beta barrel domain (DUF5777)